MRLARAAENNGDRQQAADAYSTLYYYFVGTSESDDAAQALAKLTAPKPFPVAVPDRHQLNLGRAQQLYGAKRFSDARKAFDLVKPASTGDERTLIDLRIAECDFYLKKLPSARDELKGVLDKASPYSLEAQYIAIASIRDLGQGDEYASRAKAFADSSPDSPWIEETFNDLARYYVLADDDASAAKVYTTMSRALSDGIARGDRRVARGLVGLQDGRVCGRDSHLRRRGDRHAPRGHAAVVGLLVGARPREAGRARRRDRRLQARRRRLPQFLLRSRGRARDRDADGRDGAPRRRHRARLTGAPRAAADDRRRRSGPTTRRSVRGCSQSGLYSDAHRRAAPRAGEAGDSPLIEATIAYASTGNGDLRPGIRRCAARIRSFWRRAGKRCPRICAVIFPVDYWDLVYKYATAHNLDPYLMSALIVQESTFEAGVKSARQRVGPDAGRCRRRAGGMRVALGIRPFRTARLTEPETNIRIGMAYFADLVQPVRRHRAGARGLQRRRGSRRALAGRAARRRSRRVHRRHPVSRDAELRQAHHWPGGGLPAAVSVRPSPDAAPHHAGAGPRRSYLSRPRTSQKAARFTESVIREMTRLANRHGAVNLSQGFPGFSGARVDQRRAACDAINADINQYAITWGAKPLRDAIAAGLHAPLRPCRSTRTRSSPCAADRPKR